MKRLVALVVATCLAVPAIGCAQRPAHDTAPDTARQVILITGSTDGLGRELARRLASTGAHVIVHGRNVERGTALVREIEAGGIGSAAFYAADFASLADVRRLAGDIIRDYDRLDILINNAAVLARERRVSDDGHELHFQVNYLAGYMLTQLLLPLLTEAAPSRVINVASRTQRPIRFDDVMLEDDVDAMYGYGQSKLAQIMFTFDMAEQLAGTGITVNAVHPANAMDTDLIRQHGVQPQTTVDDGAEAVLNALAVGRSETGLYFFGMEHGRAHDQAYDAAARARLRELSRALTDRT